MRVNGKKKKKTCKRKCERWGKADDQTIPQEDRIINRNINGNLHFQLEEVGLPKVRENGRAVGVLFFPVWV